MALRLLEILIPMDKEKQVHELMEEQRVLGLWHEELADEQMRLKALVSVEGTEAILDALERRFAHVEDFRVILYPVAVTQLSRIPRPGGKERLSIRSSILFFPGTG